MSDRTITEEVNVRMNKVVGQLEGILRMVVENRYCVDTLIQLSSAAGALTRIEDLLIRRHMEQCVAEAMAAGRNEWREEKIDEVINIVARFRRR